MAGYSYMSATVIRDENKRGSGMTMIIGMTGGIACGKTAATDVFRSLGVPVIDADEISRELTGPGGKALPEIAVAFGADMIGTAVGQMPSSACWWLMLVKKNKSTDLSMTATSVKNKLVPSLRHRFPATSALRPPMT